MKIWTLAKQGGRWKEGRMHDAGGGREIDAWLDAPGIRNEEGRIGSNA